MQNTASPLLAPVKPKTASGVVKIVTVSHRGFAANDPNVHRGCSECSYDMASDRLFMSEDPVGYEDGYNLYQYAQNNPLKYTDPLGTTARNTNASSTSSGANAPLVAAPNVGRNNSSSIGGTNTQSFFDNFGRHLPSAPQGLVDAFAGFGNGVSFGLTSRINRALGNDNAVDTTSSSFRVAQVLGNLHIAATGSGLILQGTRSSVAAATLISAQGAISSATNIYFDGASSGSLIIDLANIAVGFLFGSTPAGKIGAAAINFQGTSASLLVSE